MHSTVLTLVAWDAGFWQFLLGLEMAKDKGKWVHKTFLLLGQWQCSLELC